MSLLRRSKRRSCTINSGFSDNSEYIENYSWDNMRTSNKRSASLQSSPLKQQKKGQSIKKDIIEEDLRDALNSSNESKYQNARKILCSQETNDLPGREKELEELQSFLLDHLKDKKSGSMYVSGPPGTGKTACLTKILNSDKIFNKFTPLFINCTTISTAGCIYKKICNELALKTTGKTEKEHLVAIERQLSKKNKFILLVLDEIDQLAGQKQTVLYTIFEWPHKFSSHLILIGIANSLNLTDRLLNRLNSNCNLKPRLMHFAPYSKQEIVNIFKHRLEQGGVLEIFPSATIQLLAGKVAAVSGDVRRALDIGRRVVEIADQKNFTSETIDLKELNMRTLENNEINRQVEPVQLKQVMSVLSNVYGASQTLSDNVEDAFPLQQKLLICSLLIILKNEKNKDITVGRLHEVYKRVCLKRNLLAVDQTEFVALCSLVETHGIIRIVRKKESRFNKVLLQWDEDDVTAALKDKQLISSILSDTSCLAKK